MTGVTFGVKTLRATAYRNGDLDQAIVRTYGLRATLTPIIEQGREHRWPPEGKPFMRHKESDKFLGFEFVLARPWWLLWRWEDRPLRRLLEGGLVAVEFWTKLTPADGDMEWIHWAFPYTTWRRIGRGRYAGRSHDGRPLTFDGVPEVEKGAFWKTSTPPPKR